MRTQTTSISIKRLPAFWAPHFHAEAMSFAAPGKCALERGRRGEMTTT